MRSVGIIGGGLSGTLMAIHLLRSREGVYKIFLFEKDEKLLFKGVAYASQYNHHLLNVPASKMSLYNSLPNHFYDWILKNHNTFQQSDFVPRRLFGEYIREELQAALNKSGRHRLEIVNDEVVDLKRTGNDTVMLFSQNSDSPFLMDEVFLCIGNPAPADFFDSNLNFDAAECYIGNPWDGQWPGKIKVHAPVLIVGSGLTMVDQVLSLLKNGHEGKITVISRRGLLPQPHGESRPYVFKKKLDFTKARIVEILRWFREELKRANSEDFNWRCVIDALRTHIPVIWRNLSENDKRSFFTHLRPFWDTHRHRVPMESWLTIQKLIRDNRFELKAGRIKELKVRNSEIFVEVLFRSQPRTIEIVCSRVINCTGPQYFREKLGSPLLNSLLSQGIAVADPLGIGLNVSEDLFLLNRDGNIEKGIRVIGPPGKGSFWECTALAEIRNQVETVKDKKYASTY